MFLRQAIYTILEKFKRGDLDKEGAAIEIERECSDEPKGGAK